MMLYVSLSYLHAWLFLFEPFPPSQGKITAQGKLLRQGTLSITENVSNMKFKERRVFMFEQIIIFSEPLEKKKGSFNNPGYIFKKSMKVRSQLCPSS